MLIRVKLLKICRKKVIAFLILIEFKLLKIQVNKKVWDMLLIASKLVYSLHERIKILKVVFYLPYFS